MVSFWPFRSGDTTSAGFEKILSSLSVKITSVTAKDARLRSQQRRLRVLWTLYTTFTYLIALLILLLVVQPRNWNLVEYTTVGISPFVIYGVRLTIDAVYNYRLARTSAALDDLHAQRAEAISKLKAATKYDTTQQLLDKYSGEKEKKQQRPTSPTPKQKKQQQQKQLPQRTGLPPPPTANIVLPPSHGPPSPAPQQRMTNKPLPPSPSEVGASFAPNAFDPPTPAVPAEPRWYDRILDAVLGEDETSAKNRLVLLCGTCRLVNGQAAPGVRSAKELGRWRCMGCGAMNGVEAVAEQAVREARVAEEQAADDGEAMEDDVQMTDEGQSTAREHGAAARRRQK